MIERVFTIGAYGFTEREFIEALRSAGVDVLVDVRARRGVRGSAYAFANAKRLQASLAAAGIRYTHAKELAPSQSVREAQWRADASAGVGKRDRTALGPAFVAAYENACLSGFDIDRFLDTHAESSRRPVLFCVERLPEACHRSLAAACVARAAALPVEHLVPR